METRKFKCHWLHFVRPEGLDWGEREIINDCGQIGPWDAPAPANQGSKSGDTSVLLSESEDEEEGLLDDPLALATIGSKPPTKKPVPGVDIDDKPCLGLLQKVALCPRHETACAERLDAAAVRTVLLKSSLWRTLRGAHSTCHRMLALLHAHYCAWTLPETARLTDCRRIVVAATATFAEADRVRRAHRLRHLIAAGSVSKHCAKFAYKFVKIGAAVAQRELAKIKDARAAKRMEYAERERQALLPEEEDAPKVGAALHVSATALVSASTGEGFRDLRTGKKLVW